MKIGHDFGTTPMGHAAVRFQAERCTCDPSLLALDVADVRCPTHGLEAFLRGALTREAVAA